MLDIKIARGTKTKHEQLALNELKPGNFSLVTDAPELRFHDGITTGGIVIPISESTYKSIMAVYYPQLIPTPQKATKKKPWFLKLF